MEKQNSHNQYSFLIHALACWIFLGLFSSPTKAQRLETPGQVRAEIRRTEKAESSIWSAISNNNTTQPCNAAGRPCGTTANVKLSESGMLKLLELGANSALSSKAFRKAIQTKFTFPPVTNKPNTNLCQDDYIKDRCPNPTEQNSCREQHMESAVKYCADICSYEKLQNLPADQAWRYCPGLPGVIVGERLTHPIPSSYEFKNASVKNLVFGKAVIHKTGKANQLHICVPVENLQLETDLNITRTDLPATHEGRPVDRNVFSGKRLQLNLGRGESHLSPPEICYLVNVGFDGKVESLFHIPPTDPEKLPFKNLGIEDVFRMTASHLIRDQDINSRTDTDIINAYPSLRDLYGLPDASTAEEMRRQIQDLQDRINKRVFFKIPAAASRLTLDTTASEEKYLNNESRRLALQNMKAIYEMTNISRDAAVLALQNYHSAKDSDAKRTQSALLNHMHEEYRNAIRARIRNGERPDLFIHRAHAGLMSQSHWISSQYRPYIDSLKGEKSHPAPSRDEKIAYIRAEIENGVFLKEKTRKDLSDDERVELFDLLIAEAMDYDIFSRRNDSSDLAQLPIRKRMIELAYTADGLASAVTQVLYEQGSTDEGFIKDYQDYFNNRSIMLQPRTGELSDDEIHRYLYTYYPDQDWNKVNALQRLNAMQKIKATRDQITSLDNDAFAKLSEEELQQMETSFPSSQGFYGVLKGQARVTTLLAAKGGERFANLRDHNTYLLMSSFYNYTMLAGTPAAPSQGPQSPQSTADVNLYSSVLGAVGRSLVESVIHDLVAEKSINEINQALSRIDLTNRNSRIQAFQAPEPVIDPQTLLDQKAHYHSFEESEKEMERAFDAAAQQANAPGKINAFTHVINGPFRENFDRFMETINNLSRSPHVLDLIPDAEAMLERISRMLNTLNEVSGRQRHLSQVLLEAKNYVINAKQILQDKAKIVTANRNKIENDLNIVASVNLNSDLNNGTDIKFQIKEFCDEVGDMNSSFNDHKEYDVATEVSIDAINAWIKRQHQAGLFQWCIPNGDSKWRTCSTDDSIGSGDHCEVPRDKTPRIKWKDNDYVLDITVNCAGAPFNIPGISWLWSETIGGNSGSADVKIKPVIRDGRITLDAEASTSTRIDDRDPLSALFSVIKHATIIYPLLGPAIADDFVNEGLASNRSNIRLPAQSVLQVVKKPGSMVIYSKIENSFQSEAETRDLLDQELANTKRKP